MTGGRGPGRRPARCVVMPFRARVGCPRSSERQAMERDAEAFVDRAAVVLGVEFDSALRPAVVANFAHFASLFERIEGFEEPESPDPPAVYRP